MWFIGVEVEQDTTAPPPKKNPGSAPVGVIFFRLLNVKTRNNIHLGTSHERIEMRMLLSCAIAVSLDRKLCPTLSVVCSFFRKTRSCTISRLQNSRYFLVGHLKTRFRVKKLLFFAVHEKA